jgi:ribosomal-protein-alanine N-acetyltransferase
MNVAPIRTERMELVSMSPAFLRAALDDDTAAARQILGVEPNSELVPLGRHVMTLRLAQMTVDPTEQEWLLRAFIRRRSQPEMVGFGGFHGRPDARGAAELGYTIFAEHRRLGYAREAVQGLMSWAESVHGVRRFICSISPDNEASLGLAHGFGFVQTGTQWDDIDGLEQVLERVVETEVETETEP